MRLGELKEFQLLKKGLLKKDIIQNMKGNNHGNGGSSIKNT